MAGPITWRTIQGTSPYEGAGRLMDSAQTSLNSGFDAFQNVLDKRLATADENRDTMKDINLNDAQDFLSQFKTVEEFEAAQQSGTIDQQLQQYGNLIDRTAIRNALTQLPEQLRTREIQTKEFSDKKSDWADAPILDRFRAAAQSIDITSPANVDAQLNALEAQIAETDLSERGRATLLKELAGVRSSLLGDYQTTNSIRNENTRLADQLETSRQNRTIAKQNHDWTLQARNADIQAKEILKQGGTYADMRDNLTQNLADAPLSVFNRVLKDLDTAYLDLTGRTGDQDLEYQEEMQPLLSDLQKADELLQGHKVFYQTKKDNVSESEAVLHFAEKVPGEEDNTARLVNDELAKLRRKYELSPELNLGGVVMNMGVGRDEGWFFGLTDDHYNREDIADALERSLKEFLLYERLEREVYNPAKEAADAKDRELNERFNIRNRRQFQQSVNN